MRMPPPYRTCTNEEKDKNRIIILWHFYVIKYDDICVAEYFRMRKSKQLKFVRHPAEHSTIPNKSPFASEQEVVRPRTSTTGTKPNNYGPVCVYGFGYAFLVFWLLFSVLLFSDAQYARVDCKVLAVFSIFSVHELSRQGKINNNNCFYFIFLVFCICEKKFHLKSNSQSSQWRQRYKHPQKPQCEPFGFGCHSIALCCNRFVNV